MLHFLFPSVWEVETAAATLDQRWAPPLQTEEPRPEPASLGDFREQHRPPAYLASQEGERSFGLEPLHFLVPLQDSEACIHVSCWHVFGLASDLKFS